MRAKFVRGQDPKASMGVGLGPDFDALDKMAKKFGFEITEEPTHPDATATWASEKGNVHYVHGNTSFFSVYSRFQPDRWYVVIEPEETAERYPDETGPWVDPAIWRRTFNIKY